MTSRVIITSLIPETFTCAYAPYRGDPPAVAQVHETWATTTPLHITRLRDGQGFVMNLSSKMLRCRYMLAESKEGQSSQVGPVTDLIRPNEVKEIGCGPGVIWQIVEEE